MSNAPRIDAIEAITNTVEPRRNYIINGGMDFWQRGTSQTTQGYGSVDRFFPQNSGSTFNLTRQSSGVESDTSYFMNIDVTSVAASGNYVILTHRIENVSTLNGKTVTFSFKGLADVSKDITFEVRQNFGTGGSPSTTTDSIGIQKYSLTTSEATYEHSFTIPSIAGKTLGTDNNDFVEILIWLDAGSDWDARTDTLGQLSALISLKELKLEEGDTATDFVRAGTTKTGEFALCERYFRRVDYIDSTTGIPGTGMATGLFRMPLRTVMRGQPTITMYENENYPIINPISTIKNTYSSTGAATGSLTVSSITTLYGGEINGSYVSGLLQFQFSTTPFTLNALYNINLDDRALFFNAEL